EDVRDSHSDYVLPTPIRTLRRIDGDRNVSFRVDGIRIRLSDCSRCPLPSGRLLPRRGLWRHRTKGEHEQRCCPAVEHDFLQADETGPLQVLLNGLIGILPRMVILRLLQSDVKRTVACRVMSYRQLAPPK